MMSRAERKARKRRASEAISNAYYVLRCADGLLDFNKRLSRKFSDILYRLALLYEDLEGKK